MGANAVEYMIPDYLSFMRFLGLRDGKTVWLYRKALATAGVTEALSTDFDKFLKKNGYLAMGGQVIDAVIVAVPVSHSTKRRTGDRSPHFMKQTKLIW